MDEVVKIEFDDGQGRTEMITASTVGKNLYRLNSSPLFAYSVSLNDVVRASAGEGKLLRFKSVKEKSGNRTLRVIFSRYSTRSKEARPFLKEIKRFGCSYEIKQSHLLSINAPPEVELQRLADFLIEQGLWWEYADPTWEALFSD